MKSTTTQQDPSITSHLGGAVIASGCWPRSGDISDDVKKALEAIVRDHFDSGSFGMAVLYPDDVAIHYSVINKSAMTLSRADKTFDAVWASQDRHQEITGSPHRITVMPMHCDEFGCDLILFWADISEGLITSLLGDVLRDDRGEFLSLKLYVMVDDE